MNYLAHAFLSNNNPEILVGNMMGDFIKGNNFTKFPITIQQGIHFHRSIDRYTDQHPLILIATNLLKPEFRLSAGVFVDIVFDHFLANDINRFTDSELSTFTQHVYTTLSKHDAYFDEKMQTFFGYMSQYNWLYNYKFIEGLSKSILGICKRYPRLGNGDLAMSLLIKHMEQLNVYYNSFMPELEQHCTIWHSNFQNISK